MHSAEPFGAAVAVYRGIESENASPIAVSNFALALRFMEIIYLHSNQP